MRAGPIQIFGGLECCTRACQALFGEGYHEDHKYVSASFSVRNEVKERYARNFVSSMRDMAAQCCTEITFLASLVAGVFLFPDESLAVRASPWSLRNTLVFLQKELTLNVSS